MSGFEFLVVLLSIVFGLAGTQLLSGAMRLLNEQVIDEFRLVWAAVILLMIVINWWGFIGWGDLEVWTFGQYAFLMLWGSAHYVMAATLLPDRAGGTAPDADRARRVFLLAVLFALLLDLGEARLRGPLSSDLPYLLSMIGWCSARAARARDLPGLGRHWIAPAALRHRILRYRRSRIPPWSRTT